MMPSVQVFLVRHSRAIEAHTAALADDDRFLTLAGRRRAREVGAVLARAGVVFDAVLTSPLVRAVQTAELVCERLGYLGEIEATRKLSHSMPPRLIAQELAGRGSQVACFGHMPHLSELGALLTGRPGFPGFKPCQAVLIEHGAALWTCDPESLTIERLVV
jgi:phosphohistidine phosphatase